MTSKKSEYALYHGEDLLAVGTVSELAEFHKVEEKTIRFYSYPTYIKRRKPGGNHLLCIKLEDDEE